MNIETIKSMINNSTWIRIENMTVYNFVNENVILINGKSHLPYSLNLQNDKIKLQIGTECLYNIEFVNDFKLRLFNNSESFSIIPD